MKTQLLLNFFIVISFGLCYTQWGSNQAAFLGQLEWQLLFGPLRNSKNWAHPIVWGGLLGQVCILISSFDIPYRKPLHLLGIGILCIIPLLLLFTGIFTKQYRIFCSTLPFFGSVLLYYLWGRPNASKTK